VARQRPAAAVAPNRHGAATQVEVILRLRARLAFLFVFEGRVDVSNLSLVFRAATAMKENETLPVAA
jgi:hypothetical protein